MSEDQLKPQDIALWIGLAISIITAVVMPWLNSALRNAREKTKAELRDELIERRLNEVEESLEQSSRDIKTVISNSDLEVRRVMEKMDRRISSSLRSIEEIRMQTRDMRQRLRPIEEDYFRRMREDQETLSILRRRRTRQVGALNLPEPGPNSLDTD